MAQLLGRAPTSVPILQAQLEGSQACLLPGGTLFFQTCREEEASESHLRSPAPLGAQEEDLRAMHCGIPMWQKIPEAFVAKGLICGRDQPLLTHQDQL